jgi:hypothetical protein
MWWVILASLGATLLLLVIVFAAVKRAIAKAAEALASEGVELDSGPVTVTARYRKFRAPGILRYGGIRRTPGRIVLTKQRLHVLLRPQRYGIIDRAELGRFTVGVDGGELKIESSDPPGASGTVAFSAPVPDVARWVSALTAAGARAA